MIKAMMFLIVFSLQVSCLLANGKDIQNQNIFEEKRIDKVVINSKNQSPKEFTNHILCNHKYVSLSGELLDELHTFKSHESYRRTENIQGTNIVKVVVPNKNHPLEPVLLIRLIGSLTTKYPNSPLNNSSIFYGNTKGQGSILFVDIAGAGHTFVSVYDINDVLTIYTYGQYGQGYNDGKSRALGSGALVRLKGKDALLYLNKHYKDKYNIRAFYLSGKLVDKIKIAKYFDKLIDDPNAESAEFKNDVLFVKNKGSKAIKYNNYSAILIPGLTKNCVTVVGKGIKKGGTNIIGIEWLPLRLNNSLKLMDFFSKEITNITKKVKTAVQN